MVGACALGVKHSPRAQLLPTLFDSACCNDLTPFDLTIVSPYRSNRVALEMVYLTWSTLNGAHAPLMVIVVKDTLLTYLNLYVRVRMTAQLRCQLSLCE